MGCYINAVLEFIYYVFMKGSGKQIEIIYNPNLPPGVFGRTKKSNPYLIEIEPAA